MLITIFICICTYITYIPIYTYNMNYIIYLKYYVCVCVCAYAYNIFHRYLCQLKIKTLTLGLMYWNHDIKIEIYYNKKIFKKINTISAMFVYIVQVASYIRPMKLKELENI